MNHPRSTPRDCRQQALVALQKIEGGQVDYASNRDATQSLDARDRGLFLELVNGVCRWRGTLDSILDAYVGAGIGNTPDQPRRVLELALYQLLFLDRIPHHAVVDCAVESIRSRKGRGFINAVLRTIIRELTVQEGEIDEALGARCFSPPGRSWSFERDVLPDPKEDPTDNRAYQLGFEPESYELLEAALGAEVACTLMTRAQERPPITLRPRWGRSDTEALMAELKEGEQEAKAVPDHPAGVVICESLGDPWGLAALREGRCSVQGSFASRVASLVDPKPREVIADLCAAPGGKAAQLAERLVDDGGRVLAWSMDEPGAKRIQQNADRLGLGNLEVNRATGGVGCLAKVEFDALLLDVPCSNSGVLDRRPLARHRLNRKHLRTLNQLQSSLLGSALDLLAQRSTPARVIYSTCSVLPTENQELVAKCLESRSQWRLVSEISEFPDGQGQEGGYAAHLECGPPST